MSDISNEVCLIFNIRLGDKRHWYYWSDSNVRNIDEEDALSSEAYILFYRKVV